MKKKLKHLAGQKVLYFMIVPCMIYTFIFCYYPLTGWIMAFQKYKPAKGYAGSEFVGFDQFTFLFTDSEFWKAMRNTLAMAGLGILCSPITPAFAIFMSESRRFFEEYNRGWHLGDNVGMMAFDMSKPYIEGWKLKFEDRYCKGYGMMIGLCVGYEYQFGKRWLLDAFLGWAWMDSHYNGYSFDGQVDMYPHRPVQPEHPDPFNGSSEWYPNKIGVSIGYRIFTPRNKQRTADVR